ncbi:MAG TPA: DNA repair protein RecO [Rubrivivax sp.]|nr:DNA repair protein RecO [Burkholderiales bacterium]HNU11475.1 DNA repair protein RecO [Rubrivivax sp.]
MSSSRRAASAPLSAFVLHGWHWSESSLIVELFTRERGRIAVAAKGAKRPYSQLRPVLIPFQRLSVQLGRPSSDGSEVQLLRSAERAFGPPMPGGGALLAGFYLNELLLKLLARQDPHEALFDAYADAVTALTEADDAAVQGLLRAFELVLLRTTGVLPALDRVTLTLQPLAPAQGYTLHAEAGVVASGRTAVPGAALTALEVALVAGDGAALRAAVAPVAAGLRAPLRELLHYHLGSPLLRTRQLMLELHRLDTREPVRP